MIKHSVVFDESKKLYEYLKIQRIPNDYIITINCVKNCFGYTVGYELVYLTDLKNTKLKKKKPTR